MSFGCGGSDPERADPAAPAGGGASSVDAGAGGAESPPLPWEPSTLGLPPEPADNPTTPEKVALGRLLFYDPIVSSDQLVACATCHSEVWGMSDALPVSVGVDGGRIAGPGRRGENVTRRNSQTLWNVGYRAPLFWDGRAATLEEQVTFPLEAAVELDRDPAEVVAEVSAIAEYRALFEAAFPGEAEPVSLQSFTRAIAAFQRTLVSRLSLYDAYVEGDALALSERMVQGMFVFADAGCASCHVPPSFDSARFEDRAVTPTEGVTDDGRFEVTGLEEDRGRFMVPTLRNVRETDPYFHTGAVALLEDAIRHEVDVSVLRGESESVSEDDLGALIEFVQKALVDRSANPDRPDTVPSGLPVPIDDTRILR